ncbi:MAG: DUF1513 domain-containing protein [Pseudomonadota bacterium]
MESHLYRAKQAITRRRAIGLLAAFLPGSLPSVACEEKRSERWVAAQGDKAGSYGVGWVAPAQVAPASAALTGFRGHDVLQHPLRKNSVLVIARRPGTRGLEIDLLSGREVSGFSCATDRHLFGHACFSADGRVLYTTESAISEGLGRIAVRDAASYQLLDEWSSHGIGPHELRLMPDGLSLAVANSGILTRPASGRRGLNLASMRSNVSYLSAANGGLEDAFELAEPKASLRHLAVAADGSVAFAIQMQRDAAGHTNTVPLAGVHRLGSPPQLFDDPPTLIDQLKDYVGSVAICDQSRTAGFTSPRGSLAAFWNIDTGMLVGAHALRDVCGIASTPGRAGFLLSSSLGEIRELDSFCLQEYRAKRVKLPGQRWDNHLHVVVDV